MVISRIGTALVVVLLLVPAVAACGALGERLSVGSNALESDGGEPGAGEGGTTDAGVDATVVLYETQFDGPDECAAWTATGAVVSTVPGRTGNACMLCATTDEEMMYMRRDIANVPQVAPGMYEAYYVSRVVTSHARMMRGFGFSFDDVNGVPRMGGGGSAGTAWEERGSGRNVIAPLPGSVLGIYLGGIGDGISIGGDIMLRAGDCVAFDQLRVTFTPPPP